MFVIVCSVLPRTCEMFELLRSPEMQLTFSYKPSINRLKTPWQYGE